MVRSGMTCDEWACCDWASSVHSIKTTETSEAAEHERLIFTHRICQIPLVTIKMSILILRHRNCFSRND